MKYYSIERNTNENIQFMFIRINQYSCNGNTFVWGWGSLTEYSIESALIATIVCNSIPVAGCSQSVSVSVHGCTE